jgi:glucose-1-phosphate thymidylyltransferase
VKAVIPAAGQGTRLYPHTHTKPKAMVRLAGRPILGHILESLAETPIDEAVIVVGGTMQEQIVEYARGEYGHRFEFSFAEQENAEGLGHSVYQTRDAVGDEGMLVLLGDMLFENGYGNFLEAHAFNGETDGSIGIKPVEEPQHYGVAEVEDDSIVSLVEKPDDPPSNLAISGVYVIEDSRGLFDALEHLVKNDVRGAGDEYQLTDALSRMLDEGATLTTFEVQDWYDCGRPETLLEANRVLLSQLETSDADTLTNSVVVPPVDFGDDVTVSNSVVGPNVSIDDGATIETSLVSDAIVGKNASLDRVNLEESIVGTNAEVEGKPTNLNLGDNSSIDL